LVWGTLPIGGLIGGALGSALGNRSAMWIAVIGQLGGPAWLILSPLRRMRNVPEMQPQDAGVA
jgi:hypothetical protein